MEYSVDPGKLYFCIFDIYCKESTFNFFDPYYFIIILKIGCFIQVEE